MIINIRKDKDMPTYLVQIGGSMFEMSDDADQPNGVNLYAGPFRKDESKGISHVDNISIGLVRGIVQRILLDNL